MSARVAITGYMHEVNAFAEPVGLEQGVCVGGRTGSLVHSWEAGPAITRLRELRDVELVELPVWEFGASGPLRHDDFVTITDDITRRLADAGPVDGVLVFGHGAGRTDLDLDSDGTFLGEIRAVVGPGVPIVVVLDFHANVSSTMCDVADVLVGYRTNPHVDIEDRAVEAVEHLHRLLEGERTVIALCRPPMVLPQLAQNTTPGEPLAEVRGHADGETAGRVRNVSVFGGFSLSDVPDSGLSVVVTADADTPDAASAAAIDVARHAWDVRHRFRMTLTSLDDAIAVAVGASTGVRPAVILADTADNPGGGAPGNSTFVLAALLEAGVDGAVIALHCDAAVVGEAWTAGVGAQVDVVFNDGSDHPLARPLPVTATVSTLVDAPFVARRGVYRGMTRTAGRCCTLDLGGVQIAVSERKMQCADDDTFLHLGLDPRHARVVVVKSRGHFRAGFDHLFTDDQIVEVGAPGVAPAVLDGLVLANIPRPVFPLDGDVDWTPTATLHPATVMP